MRERTPLISLYEMISNYNQPRGRSRSQVSNTSLRSSMKTYTTTLCMLIFLALNAPTASAVPVGSSLPTYDLVIWPLAFLTLILVLPLLIYAPGSSTEEEEEELEHEQVGQVVINQEINPFWPPVSPGFGTPPSELRLLDLYDKICSTFDSRFPRYTAEQLYNHCLTVSYENQRRNSLAISSWTWGYQCKPITERPPRRRYNRE